MQKTHIQVKRGYYDSEFRCGVIEYTLTTNFGAFDCIEYVDNGYYGENLCAYGDSWMHISFPWEAAYDDDGRPCFMPEEDYFWQEKRYIRDKLEDWLAHSTIIFPED